METAPLVHADEDEDAKHVTSKNTSENRRFFFPPDGGGGDDDGYETDGANGDATMPTTMVATVLITMRMTMINMRVRIMMQKEGANEHDETTC